MQKYDFQKMITHSFTWITFINQMDQESYSMI